MALLGITGLSILILRAVRMKSGELPWPEGQDKRGNKAKMPPAPGQDGYLDLSGDWDKGLSPASDTVADFPLTAKLTGYFRTQDAAQLKMEGGPHDRHGRPLYSLQDYLAGKAPYVSVAADFKEFTKYGEEIRIFELEKKYGRRIVFRVVDALRADDSRAGHGTGTGRLDIRVNTKQESLDPSVNQVVHYLRVDPPAGARTSDAQGQKVT